jgi:hypothetical protein
MTIAIEDISMTEELDRKALTAVRGGDLAHPVTMPWEGSLPPSLPIAFPFPIRFRDVCPILKISTPASSPGVLTH